MQLESLEIEHFRSIKAVALPSLGRLNVLIGKNNVGKSNILSAVEAFLSFLAHQTIVAGDLPFGERNDLYQYDFKKHISIVGCIRLESKEQDTFWNRLFKDYAEMRIEPPDAQSTLWVAVGIAGSPRVSFLQSICVRNIQPDGTFVHQPLFEFSIRGASDLLREQREREDAQRKQRQAKLLKGMLDQTTWAATYATLPADADDLSAWLAKRLGEQPCPDLLNLVRHDSFENVLSDIAALINNVTARSRPANRIGDVTINGTKKASAVPPFVQSFLHDIGRLECYSLPDRRAEIGRDDAERLLSLSINRNGRDRYRRLQRTVADLLGAELEVFKGAESAELDVDKYLVNMNGSGIREALRLIIDVELKQPKALLVEEPELHLHPSLQTTMMRYLKEISSECQVFLTTHSTHFLDPWDIRNVFLVRKSDATDVQLLDRHEVESLLPTELGLRLSSVFMYDHLVFVEGPSDEDVLREWAAKLQKPFGHANVGFVLLNGSRNMSYFAAEATLNCLAKRQVRLWFVIDRDERSSPEVDRIVTELRDRAKVCFLRKRELENYLVCPRAIAEFIKEKRGLNGNTGADAPSEGEVTTAIDEAAETLKELAIGKRLARRMKPIYLPQDGTVVDDILAHLSSALDKQIENAQRTRDDLQRAFEAERVGVEAAWACTKLNIVPGDELLDTVCRKFGVRFKKEADSLRLAAMMKDEEIDPEIKELLNSIGANGRG